MSHVVVATVAYVILLAAVFLTRRLLGTFLSVLIFAVGTFLYLDFGFTPAIPWNALRIYFAVLLAAMLVYITSSEAMAQEFWAPIRRTMIEGKRLPVLALALIAIPAVAAYKTYDASIPRAVPPPKNRTVHPAPPATITFSPPGGGEAVPVDIVTGNSPLRSLPAPQLAEKIAHGKEVYYQNCFYCHGDTLSADGHFVGGVKPPPPATFRDPTVLPMFTETFFFWRISKGGPGLPEEATPFDSTMPQWEHFLSADDIWSAILFLYDYTGYKPRANEPQPGAELAK